jgi:glutamate---cysteine ligase / carboxylate-amine ligase
MSQSEEFTIGVEEEYQIVDAEARELRPRALRILPGARAAVGEQVTPEMYLSQIEIGTPVCRTLAEVRAELTRLRREVNAAAEEQGSRIAAAGTHPFSHWEDQEITPRRRYAGIAEEYEQLAREHLIYGCHVHVGIRDREAAIQVMNRARLWLAPLLALAANSPFWLGRDTGYASYRTELWRRWPLAGTPHEFRSRSEYDSLVESLVETGSVDDATKVYWDVRPSTKFETLEFRVTDVCLTVDEAVMVAGLVRALARTCHGQAVRGEPLEQVRPELLRAAKWRAARYGLDEDLIDVGQGRAVPAHDLVERLLTRLRDALEEDGAWEEVGGLVHATLRRGNGAARQRAAFDRAHSWEAVVDYVLTETLPRPESMGQAQ